MRTKILNVVVSVATVIMLLPLTVLGGVANAQQAGPAGERSAGEAQALPVCTTLVPTAALIPALATDAAGTNHFLILTGFPVPVTATWSVAGFPATPQILFSAPTLIVVKMDTPGIAYVTATVDAGSGPVCYMQAENHFAEVTRITVSPATARRPMVWNEALKRFTVQPVTVTATVLGEYPVKLGDPVGAPEQRGAPAPGGGFYRWDGTLLKVVDAPVANATVTFVMTSPCLPAGPQGISLNPDGRSGTLLPTDPNGQSSVGVSSQVKGTCSVTLTAGTSNPNLGRVSGTSTVTFYDSEAEKTPQVRWAGEEIVLEKWFGTEFAGLAVKFYLEQQSPGCLVSIVGSCDTVFSLIDQFGYARVMLDSEDQGQVDVKAVVLAFSPTATQTVKVNGFTYVRPEAVPLGLGILNSHAFLVWYLKLEDVTLGNEVLPTRAAIEAALGLPSGVLTPNQAAALIALVIGAPNTLGKPVNQNGAEFAGTPGTTIATAANPYEPGPGLPDQIAAVTGVPPSEGAVSAFAQLFNGIFNTAQPSPLVGGLIPGTGTGGAPFVTNRELLQAQVRGWFVGQNMCVNPERIVDDGNRLEILPRGRCILPDDWPALAGRLDWKQTRPTYDLMDNPGDQVKSGPADLLSAVFGNANFPSNERGAYYAYGAPSSNPMVVQPVVSLVAAYPVIGPNSSLDPAYLTAGLVFDPRISLAPRDNAVAAPLIPASCDDVNDNVASGFCTAVSPGVGARGSGPLTSPGPGGPGTGPALVYLSDAGLFFWARKTHVPNEILDWYDAAMAPAKIIFQSVGPTTGVFEAADKENLFRVRDVVGLGGGGERFYAWRTTAPFYQVEISASPDIAPVVNNGGYGWDSWGSPSAAPQGPYDFWTIVDRPAINQAVVYSDNNGRAKIFLSSGDEFDLRQFVNGQGGVDIPTGAIVGTSTVRASADYPYFRKHPAAVSNTVTKSWVSQFEKSLVGVPIGAQIRVAAVITDIHGLCPVGEEIRFTIEGSTGFTGIIVDTSDGPSGLITATTARVFVTDTISSALVFPGNPLFRGGTVCGAYVVVQNLSANAWVKAYFASELLERLWPPQTTALAFSSVHASANPFNPSQTGTTLTYALTAACGNTVAIIMDMQSGAFLKWWLLGAQSAGPHSIPWDGKNVSGTTLGEGIYFLAAACLGGSQQILALGYDLVNISPNITNMTVSPRPYYPGSGNATLSFNLSLGSNAYSKAMIVHPQLGTIKEFPLRQGNGGALTETWDGRDSGGTLVPNGRYLYVAAAAPSNLSQIHMAELFFDVGAPGSYAMNAEKAVGQMSDAHNAGAKALEGIRKTLK